PRCRRTASCCTPSTPAYGSPTPWPGRAAPTRRPRRSPGGTVLPGRSAAFSWSPRPRRWPASTHSSCPGSPPRRVRPGSPVGGGEREVLRLVAVGRTNREIGAELFISEKTASVHVSNILAKLGAANRGEAAAIGRDLGI